MGKQKSQTAVEYLLTYFWVVLIVAIIIVILFGLGLFNPTNNVSSAVFGFSGFSNAQATCQGNGALELTMSNALSNSITVTEINVSGSKSASLHTNVNMQPGSSYDFIVQNACPSAGSSYSLSANIAYTQGGLPGQYFSSGSAEGMVTSSVSPGYAASFNNYAHYRYSWGSGTWYPNADLSYMNVTQSISGTNQTYTVTMWISSNMAYGTYPPAPNSSSISGNSEPFSGFASSSADGQEISSSTGNMFLHRCTVQGDTGVGPSNPVPNFFDGHWQFVAFSVSAAQYIVMVDGQSATTAGKGQYNDRAQFFIGGYQRCFPAPFTGYISNVQLYSTALSATQLTDIYNAGILGSPISGSGVTLVGWWPMNGTVGGWVKDYSGHDFNGTLVNATISSAPLAQLGG